MPYHVVRQYAEPPICMKLAHRQVAALTCSSPRVSGRAAARRRLILCTTLRVIHVCGQRRRARSLLQSTRSRPGELRRRRTPSQWGSKQREAATGSATRPQAGGLAERARTDGALCCGQARRPPARVPSTSPAEAARRKSASSPFGRRGGLGNCMSRQRAKGTKRHKEHKEKSSERHNSLTAQESRHLRLDPCPLSIVESNSC